jgi:type IV secretory pathway TrbF-like protein
MNTVLTDLVPAIMNHPELPMGQAIAIAQDIHTKSLLADEVRALIKNNPFDVEIKLAEDEANGARQRYVEAKKWQGEHADRGESDYMQQGLAIARIKKTTYAEALQAVLKLLEAKE